MVCTFTIIVIRAMVSSNSVCHIFAQTPWQRTWLFYWLTKSSKLYSTLQTHRQSMTFLISNEGQHSTSQYHRELASLHPSHSLSHLSQPLVSSWTHIGIPCICSVTTQRKFFRWVTNLVYLVHFRHLSSHKTLVGVHYLSSTKGIKLPITTTDSTPYMLWHLS